MKNSRAKPGWRSLKIYTKNNWSSLKLLSARITRPALFYVIKNFRLIFTSISITPDRYFTISGIIIGLYGVVVFAFEEFVLPEDQGLISGDTISFFAVFLIVFLLLTLAPVISFFLTRKDTNDFAKVLSNSASTDKLIRILALEIFQIVSFMKYKNEGKKIKAAISKKRNALRTVERLKEVLAKRLMINHRELSDDFLKFSATVFINRQIKRAFLLEYLLYLDSYQGETNFKKRKKIYTLKRLEVIENYLDSTELHIKSILRTNMDLKEIEYMFQTRSISLMTYYYIYMIEHECKNLFSGKQDNFKLFSQMQKSHRTGVAIYRSIGIAIMIYARQINGVLSTEDAAKVRHGLLIRARCANGIKPHEDDLKYLVGWYRDSRSYAEVQRRYLRRKVIDEVLNRIRKIKNKTIYLDKPLGLIYIVVVNYSRIIRYIFDEISKNDHLFDSELKNVRIIVSVQSEERNEFSSRMMYHHLTVERGEGEEGEEGDSKIADKTWRSTPEALMSIFDESKDHLIIMTAPDRIGSENAKVSDQKNLIGQSRSYHWHGNIAYFSYPISILNRFRETVSGEVKCMRPEVVIVAENYKYDLKLLIDHLGSAELAAELRTPKRKRRHSGLYQWNSSQKFNVKVISVPLRRPRSLQPWPMLHGS